jgi:hypothetical protein
MCEDFREKSQNRVDGLVISKNNNNNKDARW